MFNIDPTDSNDTSEILSVSQLNSKTRFLLEKNFSIVWVEGELADFIHHGSGHMYFSLKDEKAQIRCAMFRGANRSLDFKPSNGTKVLLRAKVSLYEPRGDYQLIVEHMEDTGMGELRRAFEKLKKQLAKVDINSAQLKTHYNIELNPISIRGIWLRENMNTSALRVLR